MTTNTPFNGFRIDTSVIDDTIAQSIKSVRDEVVNEVLHSIMHTREQQVRDALIKLGWTPPGETRAQWLPIESAPKDGTAVLVGADCYPVQPASAMWVSDSSASACAPGWFINSVGNDMLGGRLALIPLDYEPTHWQPLPPPPGESQ